MSCLRVLAAARLAVGRTAEASSSATAELCHRAVGVQRDKEGLRACRIRCAAAIRSKIFCIPKRLMLSCSVLATFDCHFGIALDLDLFQEEFVFDFDL